jgi:hypothetical protein
MELGLESDVANRNFAGAVANPDSLMHVEFYMFAPIDKWATEDANTNPTGKSVRLPEQPFVRIMKPGDKDTILEVPVREDHKMRWPDKWLYFAMKNGLAEGDAADIPGWKLEEWPELIEQTEMIRDLQHMRFYTVEQIAGASDAQVQRMGMSGMGLREKAKRALMQRMDQATRDAIAERDAKIAAQDAQLNEQSQALATLQEQMRQLMSGQQEKPRRGRPPNEKDN